MTLRILFVSLASLGLGCAASPKINVGGEPDSSIAGSGGASGASGSGGGGNALTAKITEPPSEMAIEVITVSCAGECKQVLAIASGGNAPYAFTWSDGVTGNTRELCATDDTAFTVTVDDTAIIDNEFHYAGQTATASVTMQVLTCPGDAGTDAGRDGGMIDAGVDAAIDAGRDPIVGRLCMVNPSFEGTPGATTAVRLGLDCPILPPLPLQGYQVCRCSPDVNPSSSSMQAPTDGTTYLGLATTSDTGSDEVVSTALCAPLVPGSTMLFTVDLSGSGAYGDLARLQIWGGALPCGQQQLLWESDPVPPDTTWRQACGALTPDAAYNYLVFRSVYANGSSGDLVGYVNVDNFVPGGRCTTP